MTNSITNTRIVLPCSIIQLLLIKGQVTIPAEIRKKFDIKPYEQITFTTVDNQVILKPAKNFFSLKGSVKKTKTFDDKNVNTAILKYKKKEYEKKLRSC